MLECLPSVFYNLVYQGKKSSIDKEMFEKIEDHCPRDHKTLYLGTSYQKEAQELLSNIEEEGNYHARAVPNIEYRKLRSPSTILSDCPIKIYQATSKYLQHAFYGPTQSDKLNIERLNEFAGTNLTYNDINKVPHCLG